MIDDTSNVTDSQNPHNAHILYKKSLSAIISTVLDL